MAAAKGEKTVSQTGFVLGLFSGAVLVDLMHEQLHALAGWFLGGEVTSYSPHWSTSFSGISAPWALWLVYAAPYLAFQIVGSLRILRAGGRFDGLALPFLAQPIPGLFHVKLSAVFSRSLVRSNGLDADFMARFLPSATGMWIAVSTFLLGLYFSLGLARLILDRRRLREDR